MRHGLYPQIEPCESGMLDVGDGNRLKWEVSGNRNGKPAVVLHGGPGAASSAWHRRLFDPDRYRIVVFDQRGCGASTPSAADPATSLDTNTTWHLVADLERLRGHLAIDQWLVLGGSWGSALALAYAQAHPGRVSALVLAGVCALRRKETEWYWGGGAAFLFPEAWERFLAHLRPDQRDGASAVAAYHRLLNDPDPAIHLPAAQAWTQWDDATATLLPAPAPTTEPGDLRATYAGARISNHYAHHGSWVKDTQLVTGMARLAALPGVLIQGRYDVQTPAMTAWEISRAWPGAELILVELAGHSAREPAIADELVRATGRFAVQAPSAALHPPAPLPQNMNPRQQQLPR